ncbi:MAG: RimK family protein [Flammeovirgaceae bacterium]|nr:RimK family protein [Flammeovirgaceae bacterium]
MKKIIVVDSLKDLELKIDGVSVITAKDYLTDPSFTEMKDVRIFNLCKQYKYQSKGYYVSLLAEARGHKSIPSVLTLQDFKSQTIVRNVADELDNLIQKSLSKIKSTSFTLSIYFGQNVAQQYQRLCKDLYNLFQAPLLRAKFSYDEEEKKWTLKSIHPIPVNEIPPAHIPYVEEFAKAYFGKNRFTTARSNKHIYDLAILVNPEEKSPPSDKDAIERFIKAGEELGFYVELINKDDYSRLAEFDALFIRETTAVNHHTYRFARKAVTEGMVVIDDPLSILRCTNKVYLAEMLTKAKIPIPKTLIVHKENKNQVEKELGLPCVLKRPDSSFSQGVIKAKDKDSLARELEKMLEDSDLVIAQQYMPSEFDWRIGILDRQPIYACKYFMAKGHWQIYNWAGEKGNQMGKFETLPIWAVPQNVVNTALKAANLIGDGLYGVDLKEINGVAYVIEINDNPSIDGDVEDLFLKEELYKIIMRSFRDRIEKSKKNLNGKAS